MSLRSAPGGHADASDAVTPEARFAEVADDAITSAQAALGLVPRSGGLGIGRRAVLAVALAWLPLVAYALWERRFLPGSVPEPLLQHFGIHARFAVALPLLVIAEATVRASMRAALPQLLQRGLVGEAEAPALRAVLDDAVRLRGSKAAAAVLLGLVALATLAGWLDGADRHELVWDAAGTGVGFGRAWFTFVSRPIFLLALLAWFWRLGVIGWAFSRIARLDLRLAPTHPDRCAGLGFLERLPGGFVPLHLAIAVPIAGHWGHEAVYHGLDVNALRAPAVALVALNVAIAVAPLLVFAPRLRRAKRDALAGWGALLAEHGRLVERRWIRREPVSDDALLGAPELGPVADTGALYEAVRGIRAAPIARSSLVPSVLATLLPLLPVFATQVPLREIAKKLLAGLIGV